ncbi:MAG TPA: S41 family peptidase [Planctomycetaceae bacterium]|nr:S41 family peptidase [Planctomycetaceae bacterium]
MTAASRFVILSVFGLLSLLLGSPISEAQSRFRDANADFGPSPNVTLGAPSASPFSNDSAPRVFDRGKGSNGSRDPSSLKERLRPFLGDDLDAPVTPRMDRSDLVPSDLRLQLDPIPFDKSPVTPAGLSDEWQPRRNAPETKPQTPATKPALSTAEKIAKRYTDPRVVRIVQQLTPQAGEAFYLEISQMIDSRHVQPTSYDQRVQTAMEHLTIALQTPAFQQATKMRLSTGSVRSLQQELRDYANQLQVNGQAQSVQVMRTVEQMVADAGLNPAFVCMEFVYGALDTLDQYSMFIAPEKSGNSALGLKDSMVGIGVELEPHRDGLKILKVLPGGPAAEVTMKRGDIITAIDGRSIAGLEMNQAVDMIAGPAGSAIRIDLKRDNLIGDVSMVRRSFKVNSVSEVRMEANNVGYIKLDQFAESSDREMNEALWKLHNEGMQSLVIDLRGNPGGLLTTAISLSDKFLPSGTIVSTKGRTAADNSAEVAQYGNTWKVPLVVLIDHDSASASEIFAAAIQENERGVIVGEKSYGKGTVQTLFPLQTVPSALRLTTAKFYSPDGREMAGVGVSPDIHVQSVNKTTDRDPALETAVETARDPKVLDMATRKLRNDRAAMRVIKVAG